MSARQYIMGLIVAVLLFWGPIDQSWPAWFAIRVGYLIAIPLAAWFILRWIWKQWKPDAQAEDRLLRSLTAATGCVLVVMAITEALADHHIGNTLWIQTRDGREAVGDDIVSPGPDWGNVFMFVIAAGFAFWFSMDKSEKSE